MNSLTKYSHGIGQNAYHVIFRTKFNMKVFRNPFLARACENYLKQAALTYKMHIYTMKVLADHVHLFIELKPSMSISLAVNLLKGYCSRLFLKRFTQWRDCLVSRGEYKCAHLWSRWKFTRSVGSVRMDVIDKYINDSHHGGKYAYKGEQKRLV